MKSLADYRPYDVIFVDAMNLLIRSYHGMKSLEYRGRKTGMLFGVVRLVIDWRNTNPDIDIVMLWEGRASWRKNEHPIYKAHRPSGRDADDSKEFFDDLERVKYSLPTMGISQMWCDSYEADDVAFTLAPLEYRKGRRVLLSSGDWDWWELCDYGDILYQHKDVMMRADLEAMFEKKFGVPSVPPGRMWLFKVLTGDPSDNVSGIPRFPKRLASQLCNMDWVDEGNILHGLISMGEKRWAERVSDNAWILKRNIELLRSSTVPEDDITLVASAYDYDGFDRLLEENGMEAMRGRLKGGPGGRADTG